jgi:16S rRNA (uracil1498-N3)-methyltransferase
MGMPLPRARLLIASLPAAGQKASLSKEEVSHARARRLRPGDPVVLFDGRGAEALGVVAVLGAGRAEVLVEEILPARGQDSGVALLVAGLRAGRLAWLAEKATELSADRLTLVSTERTQSFRATREIVQRLERVAREAAKQCEAARWPSISGPIPFAAVISEDPDSLRLFLDPEGEPFPSTLAARPVVLLVGPEGGWTAAERGAARAQGWTAAALPAGKLRAETAAIAAVVLARAALEDGRRKTADGRRER